MKFSIFLSTLMSETTTNKRRSNGLTHRREHGRGPISLPSICILLVHTQRGRSIGCDELVGSSISPSHHTLKLFIGPSIEIHGLDSADMRSHTPVNSRAPNANKDTQVPRRPSRMLVPFTVGTYLVGLEFQQSLDSLRVLGSLAWSRTSRHNSSNSRIDV
jgi:hypothetical protein